MASESTTPVVPPYRQWTEGRVKDAVRALTSRGFNEPGHLSQLSIPNVTEVSDDDGE